MCTYLSGVVGDVEEGHYIADEVQRPEVVVRSNTAGLVQHEHQVKISSTTYGQARRNRSIYSVKCCTNLHNSLAICVRGPIFTAMPHFGGSKLTGSLTELRT